MKTKPTTRSVINLASQPTGRLGEDALNGIIRKRELKAEISDAIKTRTPEETINVVRRIMAIDPGTNNYVMSDIEVKSSVREEILRAKLAALKVENNSRCGKC